MGNFHCCCRKKLKQKIVLLLVGLDNAGKTVAAKGLAGESLDTVVPTVGFSVVNLTYAGYIVKIFDLGGGPNIRGIWHKYFVDAHGVIFVVDSSDIHRLDEAKQVLSELLSNEKISGKPVLLLANKQDNEYALDEIDIIERLDLETIVNNNECPTVIESCAATERTKLDSGIKRGYEWLLNYIIHNYDNLNKRVENDVQQQNQIEQRLRLEKLEKLRALKEIHQQSNDIDAIESYSNYERKIQLIDNESIITDGDNDANSLPIFHIERPKSSTQIIRQQLELNSIMKKPSFITRVSNKTTPLHLYNRPHTAGYLRDNNFSIERRLLRSADATNHIIDLPNVPLSTKYDNDFDMELCNVILNGNKLKHENKETRSNGIPITNGERF